MSVSTDSFIALSVLLAFKTNSITEITGIENQKLKECDRPKRVSQILSKLGVLAHETS